MISLLAKWFIKNKENVTEPSVRQAYGSLCGIVGIALNILLFAGKFFAGTVSGSIAITADAFNNLSDAGSSVITLFGFRLAGRKPDTDHPFGHGRIEYISGLVVSGLILMMGIELLTTSWQKIRDPEPVEFNVISIVIMAVSICVKLYMSFYNKQIGKKINSAAMTATATDSLSDTVSTTAVMIAMFVGRFTGLKIDGYVGLLVACFILFSAVKAAKETIAPLLGQPPEPEFVAKIEEIVMSHELICGIHDLIVHDYGPGRVMISLHAEVPAHGDLLEMHDVIDNVEAELRKKMNCEAVIHMDPIVTNDGVTGELRTQVAEMAKEIDGRITIHDFRIVPGPTHTNLIFDMVIPYDKNSDRTQTVNAIKKKISEMDGNFFAVITADTPYV